MNVWDQVALENICSFVNGGTPSRKNPDYFMGSIPWITSADVTGNVICSAREYITERAIHESSTHIVPEGNILLVTRTGVGKVAIAGVDICISQDFTGLIPDKQKVSEWYLFYLLKAQTEQLVSKQRGATIQGITRETVASLRVSLPPLPQQRRIAALLDKADHLRRTRRYALQLSDTFLSSLFLERFYVQEKKDWPRATIESLAKKGKNTIRTGPFGSQLKHSEFSERGSVAVLGIDNAVQNRFVWGKPRFITEEKYRQLVRYRVFPDDVIITIMATTGRCAVIPENIPIAISTKHVCCITLDQQKVVPTYLQYCFLTHPRVFQQMGIFERGAIMPGLNLEIIKGLVISLPPLSLQQEFARIVKQFERLRAQQREAHRQAEHLFQTLLHRAFDGAL